MKQLLLCAATFIVVAAAAQNPIGVFEYSKDIGDPALKGSAIYDEEDQAYILSGSGYNIWFERDEFHYLYNQIKGDFILTAHFQFIGEGTDAHRKIGWMIRESGDDDAAHVSATVHGDGLTVMQWRELKGAFMRDPEDEIFTTKEYYNVLQLERSGDQFIMRAAHHGEPLQLVGSHAMGHMPSEVLAGLFISSHNPEVIEKARIYNVRITRPVPADYNAYSSGLLAGRMEVLDVFSGERRIIYENSPGFEAPNFMPGGEKLLFNMGGSLYTIPTSGGEVNQLNTGFADRNNNDHGISWDGKQIAISHFRQAEQGGGSTIYVLPIEGGEPRRISKESPSYWHGWSPDNRDVVFTGRRGEDPRYNIYKASVADGSETQLTNVRVGARADGPEYSPDGQYIYYNSTESGTMQIWRMKPNGTDHEQITFDEYNDWFPHLSPDGKWMVFLSYPSDIDWNGHPFYKRVMLRMMPASGGAPRVIAYLYGGQGTINVPSWSPDSRRVAFVSNPGWNE